MALSYVGSIAGTNAPLVVPTHAPGDIIFLVTQVADNSLPPLTDGFVTFAAAPSNTEDGHFRIDYRRALGTEYTAEPNAALNVIGRFAVIYRGVAADSTIAGAPRPMRYISAGADQTRLTFHDVEASQYFAGDWTIAVARVTTNGIAANETAAPATQLVRRAFINAEQQFGWYDSNGIETPPFPETDGPLFSSPHVWVTYAWSLHILDGALLIQTLQDVELLSEAELTTPPDPINAELVQSLENVVLEATATIPEVRDAYLIATLDNVVLDSTADITLPEITAELEATISISMQAYAVSGIDARLVQTLEDVTLKSRARAAGMNAELTAVLDDVRLDSRAIIKPVGAHLVATLEDVVLRSEATITQPVTWYYDKTCCTPSLCTIDPCTLICNFINILPSGPLWDREKALVLSKYGAGTVCIDEPRKIGSCASVVDHAVYTALKFYDVLRNGLYPAIRESNPLTAFDTMDDWLDRLNWKSCLDNSCQMPAVNGLLPTQMSGPCGTCVIELDYEDCLVHSLKHATIVALTRLQFGGIKNLCFINNVIEPLGAVVFPTVGSEENCATYTLAPTREEFPIWHKLDCLPQAGGTCLAYHEPNKGARTPLPDKVFPGLIAAECIVRSMLPQSTCIEFYRTCEVPEIIPSTCFTEM